MQLILDCEKGAPLWIYYHELGSISRCVYQIYNSKTRYQDQMNTQDWEKNTRLGPYQKEDTQHHDDSNACGGTIFSNTVKMCCSHWFNKELNGQYLGRKRLGGTWGTGRKLWDEEGQNPQSDAEESGCIQDEVTSHESHSSMQIEMG